MRTNHRRRRIRLVSYALAAMLILGGFLWRSEGQKRVYRNYIEAGWERAFASLSADLTEIDTALKKARNTSSPALLGEAAAEVWSRAEDAQLSLSALPFSEWLLEDTSAYLGHLGDYARALSREAYRGALSAKEREGLSQLGVTAASLNSRLLVLQAELDSGGLTLGRLAAAEGSLPQGESLLGDRLRETEDEFPELPTLIYDGPYSESAAVGPARLLEGLEKVSEEDAIRAAAEFTGIPEEEFTVLGRSEGTIPALLLEAGRVTVRVSRQGGKVVDMVDAEGGYDGGLSPEAALASARKFLAARGYPSLRESYWTKEEGSLLVSFHHQEKGVTCYPDLIKVRVDLEAGKVIGFDAQGYLMSHHARAFPPPIPAEAARQAVSPSLKILSEGLALIPTEGKQERLCWEFKCQDGEGTHFIVYADAATGEEVKLLYLLEDENGTLVL
ncbi:MAG: germination protein YpeB [Oscillospiraceae bacterium]|nr:germination protein YpeB [Oscillospiraceae bacterium]